MPHFDTVIDPRLRPQAPPSTILVVDDNAMNLQLVVRTLEGRGHRILAARNGAAALEIARRAAPDLILLDVLMPDMNGFDVYERLNAPADRPHVPVIFLSALDEAADKIAGLGLGAVDYVTKPIQPEEVLARVENHLIRLYLERELRRNRDRLDRELADAADLQRLMLPQSMPAGFAAHYRTSRHAGGDYYDFAPLDEHRVSFIVADVSGHGASAAIVMAMIRALFHTLGARGCGTGRRASTDQQPLRIPARLRGVRDRRVWRRGHRAPDDSAGVGGASPAAAVEGRGRHG